jgi:hypothetical protein
VNNFGPAPSHSLVPVKGGWTGAAFYSRFLSVLPTCQTHPIWSPSCVSHPRLPGRPPCYKHALRRKRSEKPLGNGRFNLILAHQDPGELIRRHMGPNC